MSMHNLIQTKKYPSTRTLCTSSTRCLPASDINFESPDPTTCKVYNSIVELVGNTPLVRLNKIPKQYGLKCDIYAKCEFFNPCGSIKDRIAVAMLQDAKKKGVIKPDTILVESTSGNTGIGVAFNAALNDLSCKIVMHKKNSDEKKNTMSLLGAEVITIKDNEDDDELAHNFKDSDPKHVVILDQTENDINPKTHYEKTGVEILVALQNRVDAVVMGAGTGGTMSGVGSRVKESCPDCLVVAIEPEGSAVLNPEAKSHPFLVEGIGGKETPIVFDKSIVDHVETVSDKDAFLMARELSEKEGLMCGGSSGAAMIAAVRAAKKLGIGAGKNVVVILPDGIRNYMTKFVTEQWMEAHLFKEPPKHKEIWWWNQPATNINFYREYHLIDPIFTCEEAYEHMKDNNAELAIVAKANGELIGAVTMDTFRRNATDPPRKGDSYEEFNWQDKVTEHLVKDCYTLAIDKLAGTPTVGLLSRVLDITPFVVLGYKSRMKSGEVVFYPSNVVTADEVIQYIFEKSIKG